MPLHPEMQMLLPQIEAMEPFTSLSPPRARANMETAAAMLGATRAAGVRVHDEQCPGPQGPLTVRIYQPETPDVSKAEATPRPALVFFHGGGWVIGSLNTYSSQCAALARNTGAVVLSVDYRLAPEHRFPAAVDDALTATRWAFESAGRLGLDPARIGLIGDSAGGNLAAVVAQALRGTTMEPCLQALIYPATDAHGDYPEKREHIPGMLNRAELDWFLEHYLRSDEDRADPRCSPLLTPDLTGLPPAIVALAEYDPLRPEGAAYSRRLQEAGVAVEVLDFPGLIHGFLGFAAMMPSCRSAEDQIHARVRAALVGGA